MSGSSIFSPDFNWETVSKLVEKSIEEKNAKALAILRLHGAPIEHKIKAAAQDGQAYCNIEFDSQSFEYAVPLIRALSTLFPGRVYYYEGGPKVITEEVSICHFKSFRVDLTLKK